MNTLSLRTQTSTVVELSTEQQLLRATQEINKLLSENVIIRKALKFANTVNNADVRLNDLEKFAFDNDLSCYDEVSLLNSVMSYFELSPEEDILDCLGAYSKGLRAAELALIESKRLMGVKEDKVLDLLHRAFYRNLRELYDAGTILDTKGDTVTFDSIFGALKLTRDNPKWTKDLLSDKALKGEKFVVTTLKHFPNYTRHQASTAASRARTALKQLGVIVPHSVLPQVEVTKSSLSSKLYRELYLHATVEDSAVLDGSDLDTE